ncbi:multidrug efflux MFS transporter [Paenibacillus sp. sptzw28]|uniref:MDR family MFS transporter n=1 Tax=Paenibacillus sp. sptzw28 TaxID=715179 RepID=UPI001C6F1F0D|nr:MDR family MFS transporter [Paenibacillus sp. sptzw28]QYR22712.1 multidrug efflux MFS transporter [Paenibacillus sp. sptzw28]
MPGSATAARRMTGSLSAIMTAMFIVYLDHTVMNVMLPRLIKEFHSTYNTVHWTVTGYVLAQAAVIPLAGWLSDRYGAKRIFLLAIGWFAAGSLLCAVASGIEQLILFRIVQGLGGGMIAPIGFAYIYRLSPPGQVGRLMAKVSIPILLAPALGPAFSGYLADSVGWQWIFLMNIPVCIFGLYTGIHHLPRIKSQAAAELDLAGFLLAPLTFVSLSYGISASEGSSWGAIGGLATGGMALFLLVVTQLRRSNPLLELRVYRSGHFAQGSLVLGIAQFAFFGTLYLIPQFLQVVNDFGAFEAGSFMIPYAVALGIVMQFSGRLFDNFGVRWLAVAGTSCLAFAMFVLYRIEPDTGNGMLLLAIVLLGASAGLCMMPLQTYLMKAAPKSLVGRVTSLTGSIQQVMVSFAVSGMTTVLTSRLDIYAKSASLPDAWLQAFRDAFTVILVVAVIGACAGLFIRNAGTDDKPMADA